MIRAKRALAAVAALGCVASLACTDRLLGPDKASDHAAVFDELWRDFDLHYSFFDFKQVDWKAIGAEYRPRAIAATTEPEFAVVLARMLDELHDVHVAITPTGIGRTMRYLSRNDTLPTHFDPEVAFRRYLRTIAFTPRRNFRYGMLADSVGYLHLPTFAGEQLAAEVDSALVSLPFASTLIIDVRNNRGGSVDNAREIAGRFADASHVYGYRRLRDGPAHGDFTGFIEERVEPVGGRSYRGAVVVITNRRVFSSAEDFVLAMRALPNVTIVGDTTAGASGGPIVRELTNGWTYELSEWIEYTPERRTFEEIGLTPDIALKPTAADAAAGSDPVLERAMLVATRQRVSFR